MDPRIKRLLEESGFQYRFDDAMGSYGMVFHKEGRPQIVWVDPDPDEMGAYSDFTIWSPIADSASPDDIMTAMHIVSDRAHLGAFLLRPYDAGYELVYAIDIGPDCDVDMFKAIVSTCGQLADAAARELGL